MASCLGSSKLLQVQGLSEGHARHSKSRSSQRQPARVSCSAHGEQDAREPASQARPLQRRDLVFASAAAASLLAGLPACAQEVVEEAAADASPAAPAPTAAAAPSSMGLKAFENGKVNYSLMVPSGWEESQGTVGTRSLVAFHPASTTTANVSVLITPLGADFTGLGSFGTVDNFAESLVNGLDRSYLRKPGQRAELIDAKSRQGMYLVEYTIQKPGEQKVHLLSAISVFFNGIYNQLYTLTAQWVEDDSPVYEGTIREVFNSFKISKA